MIALSAQTGPVFLTYRGRGEIDAIVEGVKRTEPLFDFTASDGVAHAVWRIGGEAAGRLAEQFRPAPLLYIADGHHRAASAARARRELAGRNPKHTGEEEYNFFLAVAFPAGQVRILPYNRVVKDLHGRTPEDFLDALREKFSVTPDASPSPARKGQISVYLAGRWYGLQIPPGGIATGGAISSLDAALLQEKILEPLLGIKDIRTDKRIEFVGGIRGTAELERLVDCGKFGGRLLALPGLARRPDGRLRRQRDHAPQIHLVRTQVARRTPDPLDLKIVPPCRRGGPRAARLSRWTPPGAGGALPLPYGTIP